MAEAIASRGIGVYLYVVSPELPSNGRPLSYRYAIGRFGEVRKKVAPASKRKQ